MAKTKHRVLSLLLSLAMVLTLLPANALAGEDEGLPSTETVKVSASDLYAALFDANGGDGEEECEATLEDVAAALKATEVYLETSSGTVKGLNEVIQVTEDDIYWVTDPKAEEEIEISQKPDPVVEPVLPEEPGVGDMAGTSQSVQDGGQNDNIQADGKDSIQNDDGDDEEEDDAQNGGSVGTPAPTTLSAAKVFNAPAPKTEKVLVPATLYAVYSKQTVVDSDVPVDGASMEGPSAGTNEITLSAYKWWPGGDNTQRVDAKITANLENVECVYAYFTNASEAASVALQSITNGQAFEKEDFAVSGNRGNSGYVVFFVKPTEGYLLTSMEAGGSNNLYSLSEITGDNSAIKNYPGLNYVVQKAEAAGYIAGFGYSRGGQNFSELNTEFTVTGKSAQIAVSAKSTATGMPTAGNQVTFDVTITPATVEGATMDGSPRITELKVNGSSDVSCGTLTDNHDGTWTTTVTYTVTEADITENEVTLSVSAAVDYQCTLGFTDGSGAVTTEITATSSDTATCKVYPTDQTRVQVYLNGSQVNANDYITVSGQDSTANFSITSNSDAETITFTYTYDQYNCADIVITPKSSADPYVLQAISASLIGGEKGSKGITQDSTTYKLDNVAGGSTVKVYLYTPYTVEYYKENAVYATDNGPYLVETKTESGTVPNISGTQPNDVTAVFGNYSSSITLKKLPDATQEKIYGGWYLNAAGAGEKYEAEQSCNVSAVKPTTGNVIKFYATATDKTYTVTYNKGAHGSLTATAESGSVDNGNIVYSGLVYNATTPTAPNVTAADGWYFTGWDQEIASTVTETVTYTAQYAQKTPLTVKIADKTVPYTGSEQEGYGYQTTDGDGKTEVTGDLADGHTITVANYTPAKGTNANTYTNGTTNPTITVKDSTGANVTEQYKITFTPGTLTITPKTITASDLSFTAQDKQYDGNTVATGSITFTQESGITGVTVNASSKTFSDKNVGTDKTVTASGLSLRGDTADNYQLADGITLTDTANITPATLNVTVNFTDRDYVEGKTSVDVEDVTITSGLIADDNVTVTASGSGTMDDAYVGTNKTVSNTSAVTVTASGNDAKNYTLNKAYGKVTIYGKVTYAPNADGDTVANMPADNNQYEYDAPVTASTAVPSPARDNYTFVGWALTPTATANECVETAKMGTTGITFYAVWSRDTYQVTVQYQYSDDKQTFADYSYTDDSQPNPFTVNAGNIWTIGIAGKDATSANYTAPATLTVNGKTYVYDAYATTDTLSGSSAATVTLKYGLDTNKDDTPDYYQVFLEFKAGDGGYVYGLQKHVITFDNNATAGDVEIPTDLVANAVANPGYGFVNWTNSYDTSKTGDKASIALNSFKFTNVPGNTTITFTANFATRYTLTFDATKGQFPKEYGKTYTDTTKYAGDAEGVALSGYPTLTGPVENDVEAVLVGWTLDQTKANAKIYSKGENNQLPALVTTVDFKSENITVYAVWGWDTNDNDTPDVLETLYQLTFDANGQTFKIVADDSESDTYIRGETYLTGDMAAVYRSEDKAVAELVKPDNVLEVGWTTESEGKHIDHIFDENDAPNDVPTTWAQVTFVDKDITLYAVWAYDKNGNEIPDYNEDTYGVKYDWGTVVLPESVTLPTNTNTYLVGMPVAVDSTYSDTTTVPDTVNGVPGTWSFSGWHLGNTLVTPESSVAMREDGLTFTGKWEFVEQGKATVSYSWTGNVPAGVVLPASVEDYEGFSHTVDTTFYAGRTIVTADGVYTFNGWNQSGTITVNTNTVITGTWSFTPYNRSVSVTKSCGISTAEVDDVITYTIRVTNTGDVDLSDVTITDTFTGAGSLTFSGADGVTTNGNGTYTITIDDLPSQRTVSITATYTVVAADAGTTITNTAVSALDTDDTDDSTVVTVEPVDPDPDPTPDPEPDDPRPDRPNRPNRPSTDNDDTTDIVDEEVPLAELPGLNTVDHFAYITGYDDGTVRPEGYISRAEVATIFFRLMTDEYRETYWSTTNLFTDVAVGSWYNNAISTTANVGWITGYPDGTYRPNNYITRAEFATIAARFLSEEYDGENMFTDIDGHWAAEYINRAARAGWITGYAGLFRPDDYITRAEAVTLINRMLDRAPDADHMLANMVRWPDNPETAWYYEAIQEATNSHDYDRETIIDFETWTELLPNRDWAALEEVWAQAGDAAGGEVADGLFPDGNDNN